jgi:hypothetical protein
MKKILLIIITFLALTISAKAQEGYGSKPNVGPQGVQGIQGIQGVPGPTAYTKGTATIDLSSSNQVTINKQVGYAKFTNSGLGVLGNDVVVIVNDSLITSNTILVPFVSVKLANGTAGYYINLVISNGFFTITIPGAGNIITVGDEVDVLYIIP